MKDPTPWLNPTELERQLLDGARHDAAPAAIKLRMAEAVLSLPPLAAAQSAAQSAASTTAARLPRAGLLFSHPALWGSLAAMIVAGAVGWQAVSHRAHAPAQIAGPAAPLAAAPPQQAAVLQPVAVFEAPVPSTNVSVPASTPVVRSAEPARAGMREELALLDAARSALASSETTRALRLLDQHAEQFSRGHLAPEADALRIDALVQRGSTDRAKRLARNFLQRHPSHPLAAHIAAVAQ